jgi:hypothetical protein
MISVDNVIETYKKNNYRSFEYFGLKIDCTYTGARFEGWRCRLGSIISMRERGSPFVFNLKRLTVKTLAETLEYRFLMNENKTLMFDHIFETKRV